MTHEISDEALFSVAASGLALGLGITSFFNMAAEFHDPIERVFAVAANVAGAGVGGVAGVCVGMTGLALVGAVAKHGVSERLKTCAAKILPKFNMDYYDSLMITAFIGVTMATGSYGVVEGFKRSEAYIVSHHGDSVVPDICKRLGYCPHQPS